MEEIGRKIKEELEKKTGIVKIFLVSKSEMVWGKRPEDDNSITGRIVVRKSNIEYNQKGPVVGSYTRGQLKEDGIELDSNGMLTVFVPYETIQSFIRQVPEMKEFPKLKSPYENQ